MLSEEDKMVLKELVKRELKDIQDESKEVLMPSLPFLASVEKYEEFLKELEKNL